MSPLGNDPQLSQLVEALANRLEALTHDPSQDISSLAEVERLAILLPKLQTSFLRMRNGFAPINRLPVEVLSYIFDIARDVDWRIFGDQQSGRVVRMSLVCRHWRHVALLFPKLWSTIQLRQESVYDFQFALLCLERSKSAPLKVVISTLFRGVQIADFLAPYAHRIREVALLVPFKYATTNVPAYVVSTCSFHAPNLETLRICTPMWGCANSPVLPTVFNGDIPHVKRLHIECFASWPGHRFSGLTHLALGAQAQYTQRPSMEEFLDLIEMNPLLEQLLLDSAGPTLYPTTNRPPVSLPNLRLLCFNVSQKERALPERVLTHLILPDTTTTRIFYDMDPAAVDPSLPLPAELCSRSADKLLFRDSTLECGEPALRLSAISSAHGAGLAVSHRLRDAAPHERWAYPALRAFLQPSLCADARALWLDMGRTGAGLGEAEWRSVLEAVPAAEELTIARPRLPCVLRALRAQAGVLPVPGLRTLRLLGGEAPELEDERWDTEREIQALRLLGRERADLGRPVRLLQLVVAPRCADLEAGTETEAGALGLDGAFGKVELLEQEDAPVFEQPPEMLQAPFGRDIPGLYE
ncbi:hypothetical protein DENSPDRAFT_885619 [Dentipellis sp. KUC8613]|nr:hypothetical protein DENSPDRAFT_885619 [Dentipellis sp. KUC8613]